ncbi:MhpC Predicted hydrolases or acyltransferases (alpha/beta hydrolase superfamily) [Mycobacteriaceae bacterium]
MSREWARRAVDVDGHRVMTYALGAGPRTVLLVHGGPGCPSRYLRDSHEALVDRGLRLVTWDQLGCGESDHPADTSLWRLDRFVTELETVRASLGLDEFDLLGQSWGGVLGLEYLLHHPDRVRTFVAADTAFDLAGMQRGFDRKKLALGEETVTMMARHEAEGTTDHPEYQAAVTLLMYRHVCRLHPWPESLSWCMQNLGEEVFARMFGPYFFQCTGTLRDWDRMDALENVDTPVLLVHGEHDYIVPELAARARDRLPGATLAFFPGCSHMPFFEAPDQYLQALCAFWDDA